MRTSTFISFNDKSRGKLVCYMVANIIWDQALCSHPQTYEIVNGAPAIIPMTQVGKQRRRGMNKGDQLVETVSFKESFLKLYLIICLSAKGLRKVVF